jgi:hypothetical protein
LFKPAQQPTSQGHSQSLFMPSNGPSSDTSSQSQSHLFAPNVFAPRKSTPLPAFGNTQPPKPLFATATAGPSVEKRVQEPQPEETDIATTPPGSPKIAHAETNVFNQGPKARPESRSAMMESTHPVVDEDAVVDGDAVTTTQEPPQPIRSPETGEWQPPGKLPHSSFNILKIPR